MYHWFDPTSNDIIVITYPPGGFGNFLFFILTEFVEETVKVNNSNFEFSLSGDSHSTAKYCVTFDSRIHKVRYPCFSTADIRNKKILILSDSGVEHPSIDCITHRFPNAQIIRTYSDVKSKLLLYLTSKEKAMKDISELSQDWESDGLAKYLSQWLPVSNAHNISLTNLVSEPVETIKSLVAQLNLTLINEDRLATVCNNWKESNSKYFKFLQ